MLITSSVLIFYLITDNQLQTATSGFKLPYNDTLIRIAEERLSQRNNETRHFRGRNYFHLTKFKIVTNNWTVCSNKSGVDLDLLVYVITMPTHLKLRDQARRTYANRTLFPNMNVVFVLGKSRNLVVNLAIEQENRFYGDIVQADFVDAYSNLTFKSLVAWRWIKHNCRNAKFYMKMDGDVFMNTKRVLDHITNKTVFNVTNLSLSGDILFRNGPHRKNHSKWYVSYENFPDRLYPPFAHGPFYIMSNQLVPLFYELSFTTRDFIIVSFFNNLFLHPMTQSYFF
jgi:hypothetical protein